jgi:hypothetical protein
MSEEKQLDTAKPICAVVDTSVWRAEPLLKTPMGETLVYMLNRRGSFIGLPEVVELELTGQIVKAGIEAVRKVSDHLHLLETIMGHQPMSPWLPKAELLRQKVDERIAQLKPLLVREAFTLDHAKSALAMVNAKVPPNSESDQQFKDSAIWHAVLSLSIRFSTVLLTNDTAFFRNKKPEQGLAENLAEDCMKASADVRVFCGIRSFLEALKCGAPEFDREKIIDLIIPTAMQRVSFEAERGKYVATEPGGFSISAFPTENPDRLAIDYTFTFKLYYQEDRKAKVGFFKRGVVHGSAYFVPKSDQLTDHYIQRVVFRGHGSMRSRDFKDYDNAFAFPRPLGWDVPGE